MPGIAVQYFCRPWERHSWGRPTHSADEPPVSSGKMCPPRKADPVRILEGRTVFNHEVDRDRCWDSLAKVPEQDKEEVCNLLTKLLHGMIAVMDRQLSPQLPEGEICDHGAEPEEAAMSCSSSNISGERNFAVVDSILHKAPNVSNVAKAEAKVMFKVNKTCQWMEKKTKEEWTTVATNAMKEGKEG